jgi:hypothetical protein
MRIKCSYSGLSRLSLVVAAQLTGRGRPARNLRGAVDEEVDVAGLVALLHDLVVRRVPGVITP